MQIEKKMTIKIGINGFGRMGRLAFRAAWDWPEFEIVHVNEIAGGAASAAHLLNFDSVHGRYQHDVQSDAKSLVINNKLVSYSQNKAIADTPWQELGVDIVVECTGKFKTKQTLAPYLQQGIKKVVVSAPVKEGALNVVMGVNDVLYDASKHDIVTAASCTTNCIAPVIKVIHEAFSIKHGSITTMHDITNTQSILDEYHKDLRRARASGLSLIPTSTGSATAITKIFPELKGKLNGIAVRVPLANASLTDCIFEVEQEVTKEEVNAVLEIAAKGELKGILGFEKRPLVSSDYTNDQHSSTIDALSTMVINGTQVKLLAWYDNEIGYVHRMMELTKKVAKSL
jgi:glyceraldehyde 3-phosphate dehydrogenase